MPRSARPRIILLAAGALALAGATFTHTRLGGAARSKAALAPLTVSGAHIVRNRVPFRFYGVNRDSLEWGRASYGGCGGDGHFTDRDFDLIRSWNATVVRLPLSQAGWLGRRCDAAQYAGMVDAAVAKVNARGMYAILDLHWSDVEGRAPCDSGCPTGQQPMPDADSLVFWRSVARRYANRPGVVFGVYNEPHDVSWACWRDGGCKVAPSVFTAGPLAFLMPYTAVGMQPLVDAIRAQGARNLVLVGGLDWAYDLSGVVRGYALRGANIAYDTHVYTLFHSQERDWDAHFGLVTGAYPVVSTEFGSSDCSTAATERLLRYFAAPMGRPRHRMSWTIWSWNDPGNCSQPSVIADWNGTPLRGQGELIRRTMLAAKR